VAFAKTAQTGKEQVGAEWVGSSEDAGLSIRPAGITSAEAFGTAFLQSDRITPDGIVSAAAFGTASLNQQLSPSGIATAEVFGSPTVALRQEIVPDSVVSEEAFGTPSLDRTIGPTGIATAEALGKPTAILQFLATGPGSNYRVYVDDVLVNQYVLKKRQPISFSHEAGSFGSCRFTWFDPLGATRPEQDQEVVIVDAANDNLRVFGGLIVALTESFYKGLTAMEIGVRCAGWGVYLERRVAHKFYTTFQGGVASILLASITTDFLADTGLSVVVWGGAGGVIGEFEAYAQKVSESFRRIMQMINADFWVDNHKVIHVFPKNTGYAAAPFSLTDNDGNFRTLTVERNTTLRANRIFVKNSRPMRALWVDTFAGDEFGGPASGTIFPTSYFQVVKPTIYVNDVLQVVVAIGDWSVPGWQWYYIPGGTGVFQNWADAPLGGGDTIAIAYPSPLQYVYIAEDVAAIAADGLQEAIVEGKDLPGYEEMEALGDAELLRRKINPVNLTAGTDRSGLFPGQLLTVNTTQPLLDDTLVVKSSSGRIVDGEYTAWTVKATNTQLQKPDTVQKYMADMIHRDRQPVPRGRYSIHIILAGDLSGGTNAGLVAQVVPGARTVERSGWIREWRMGWEDGPPFTQDISIDIKLNGATIFPTTKAVYEAGEAGTVLGYTFSSANLEVAVGDKITAEALTTESTAKNGWLDLIIEG
jgi:hypothetical protein